MHHSPVRSIVGVFAVLVFASAATAQGTQKLPGKETLYRGNRLRPDPTPGGPAPVHDIGGSWAGNRGHVFPHLYPGHDPPRHGDSR